MVLTAQDRDHLRRVADELGVALTAVQLDALDQYVDLLLRWNRKVNLTAVTETAAIVDKHLLDSLAVSPHVRASRLLDVGTGPGLPAIALAIADPALVITAVESIQKKVAFVRTVARELGLAVTVQPVRLEALSVEPYDTAVSRATFEPAEWVERGVPFVAPGGRLIAMLSAHQVLPAAPDGFAPPVVHEHRIGDALRRIACYDRRC